MLVHDLMAQAEPHINIVNAFAKTWDVLGRFSKPVVSISGGADSDIVLDMIHKLDEEHKAVYVWYNTGLEYQATKRHLDFLEAKYSVEIKRIPPVKPIALTVKEYGYPFLSKFVSDRIASLQKNGFDFTSVNSYEEDAAKYPKCHSRIMWWHNISRSITYNIARNKLLKEFMSEYPPELSISSKCCYYSKKRPAQLCMQSFNGDLNIIGIRKAEGGARRLTQNCFTQNEEYAVYRPIFWFTSKDKAAYEEIFGVTHSECYSVYGLKRTGCAGCPYSPRLFDELDVMKRFECGLARAAEAVFEPVYDYTRRYKEYRERRCAHEESQFQSEAHSAG